VRRYWTDEEIGKLQELARRRVSPSEIALALGRSESSVKFKLWRLGYKTKFWTDDDYKTFRTLAEKGLSLSEIAGIMGRSYGALRHVAYRLGIKTAFAKKPRAILALNDAELAYIAGIIDGEGHIGMVKTQDGYDPVVSVANTSKELIDWIMNKVPTGALTTHQHLRKPNWKIGYVYTISSYADIVELLQKVLRYLIVKRRQAELMIEYCKVRLSSPLRGFKFDEIGKRYYQEFRELNK
jgi:hypothetical protein